MARDGIPSPAEARVLAYLSESPGVSGATLTGLAGLNRHAAYSSLTRLRALGQVKASAGVGASRSYKVTARGRAALRRARAYYADLSAQLA